jgi:hypothetical protein
MASEFTQDNEILQRFGILILQTLKCIFSILLQAKSKRVIVFLVLKCKWYS